MSAYEYLALLRRCVLIGLAVIWGIIGLSAVSSEAGDSELERKTLRGLQGVYVVVEDLAPDAQRAGLTKQQLQTDAELRLRKAGIPLLTSAEQMKVPGKPFLGIYLQVVPHLESLFAVYSITVELCQVVALETDALMAPVATWRVRAIGSVGITHLATLRGYVRDYVDQFINA